MSIQETTDDATGISSKSVVDWRSQSKSSDLKPRITLRDEKGNVIKKADELIKIYPYEKDLHNIQGASNAALSKFDKAIICYENILKIDPNSAKAYFNIAVMYDKLSLPKNALYDNRK